MVTSEGAERACCPAETVPPLALFGSARGRGKGPGLSQGAQFAPFPPSAAMMGSDGVFPWAPCGVAPQGRQVCAPGDTTYASLVISKATWTSSQSPRALSAIMAESFRPACHSTLFQGQLWRAEASERRQARVLSPSPVETH